jgi:hypothetical protein
MKKTIKDCWFTIPSNIMQLLNERYGVNLQYNINSLDGLNGYGSVTKFTVVISFIENKCAKCGYSSLFNTKDDLTINGHYRHTLKRVYTPVFSWDSSCGICLSTAFDKFVEENEDYFKHYGNLKTMYF